MDWIEEEWRQLSYKQMASYFASIGIIFGGVLPYIPQYRQIKDTQNADGFSTYVCLTLLLANTLRIMFWFGHPFETPLLVQSVVMNSAMIAMIELCVRVKNRNLLVPNKNKFFIEGLKSLPNTNQLNNEKTCMNITLDNSGSVYFIDLKSSFDGFASDFQQNKFFDFDWRYFWQWTDFTSYIEFLAVFTVFSGILMYIFHDISIFVESIGFLSVFIEAILGAPQLFKNYENKSTLGMSKLMVLLWTVGDIFKTLYFLVRSAPIQFWICGLLQVSIDLLIFGQTIIYRKPYKRLSKAYIQ